ncbi:Kinase suppressor of Ras 2 [Sciurus carolinensis]|uniref:Kinase suppressor of Ras 2 n=1 Tax=Sciurus carolinensis TaxID=30640 RepID=A0AA41N5Y5_SCICA|nr:Kinase suppressor of Ras 2 [Sciurus carolinensis]
MDTFPSVFCLPLRAKKKSKPLNLKIHSSVGSCENIPTQQRSPLLSERSLRSFFVGHAPFLPSTPPIHTVHTEANFSANTLSVPRWSPQIPRRDLGNSIKHRFSTKYWMSQTCTVCGKGMLFGLKCKNCNLEGNPLLQIEVEPTSENEEGHDEAEESEDDFEEMNLSLLSARSFPRKASQTSIFLQEWDIPFEQLEVGELIGKGRFGQVYHGRWHGEVAIRLIDIERDNEDQLKAFKREVMAYRQTRHENVVLFMGACMSPPHLAIITSLCKGRTLYSVVRDAKIVLDVNKTRQIAQEIVKGMGYLHAKGILHKDLKSKNVFYDNGKVVITDFGLFSISGVLQAGRREDKLRIQNGWLCHLAPEIIRQLSPDTEEDKLPFSKHSDVFALG